MAYDKNPTPRPCGPHGQTSCGPCSQEWVELDAVIERGQVERGIARQEAANAERRRK